MRVLLAEDDSTSRKLLERVLLGWDYEVVAVEDGRRAWEVLNGSAPPSLAILDWEMPYLDGVALCRRTRALDTASPPYILLLTARSATEDIVAGLDAGANDFLTKPVHKEELRARLEVGRRLVELNAELVESRRCLEVQALTDPLTGIMNRRAVLDALAREIAQAKRTGEALAVGMMDIDNFKRVNDAFGHAAGDQVLKEVVLRADVALRAGDSLGRFGGEEFLLVLTGASKDQVQPVLERVRAAVGDTPIGAGLGGLEMTVSLGGALWARQSIDDLVRQADDALYCAKSQGRNRVVMAGRRTAESRRVLPARESAVEASSTAADRH